MSKLKSTSANSMNTFGATAAATNAAASSNFAKPAPNLGKPQLQSNSADGASLLGAQIKASTFTRTQAKNMECLKDNSMQLQLQQKKKRTALENISNVRI